MTVFVVAVSGATCSGKTQMCRKFVESQSDAFSCEIVSMDGYYWHADSDKHVRLAAFNNYANYEDTGSVNWKSMVQDALAKINKLESNGDEGKTKILFIEGILVLNSPLIDELSHLRVFIRLDDREEFILRRRTRVYEDDPVPENYDEAVTWPMYVKNSASLNERSDVVFFNGTDTPDELYSQFCTLVKRSVQSNAAFI